jgi:hypothetical protein
MRRDPICGWNRSRLSYLEAKTAMQRGFQFKSARSGESGRRFGSCHGRWSRGWGGEAVGSEWRARGDDWGLKEDGLARCGPA